MTSRKGKHKFDILIRTRVGRVSTNDVLGLIDMMRYDDAQVTAQPTVTDDNWIVIRLETSRPPTLERWHSFGIQVQNYRPQ